MFSDETLNFALTSASTPDSAPEYADYGDDDNGSGDEEEVILELLLNETSREIYFDRLEDKVREKKNEWHLNKDWSL